MIDPAVSHSVFSQHYISTRIGAFLAGGGLVRLRTDAATASQFWLLGDMDIRCDERCERA